MKVRALWLLMLTVFLACSSSAIAAAGAADLPPFPRPTDTYHDQDIADLWQRLKGRAAADPFNLVATVIFLLAIVHTFLASKFLSVAHHYEHRFDALESDEQEAGEISKVARKRDQLARARAAGVLA